ncbi:MAG: SDR family oxidoreductase, partial [Dolichospermum sp.]
ITVNVVSPGIAENSFDLQESLPELPTKRPATLQELAHAAWFFISPESDYITGQVLDVSGGWRL